MAYGCILVAMESIWWLSSWRLTPSISAVLTVHDDLEKEDQSSKAMCFKLFESCKDSKRRQGKRY